MWSSALSFSSFRNQCRGCDHPRPKYTGGYASVRSNLGTMLSNAKYVGCEVCAILSEGILKFLSDESCGVAREDVDELRIDFNLAATRRSLEVALLGTPIRLCFYASEATPWLTENLPDLPVGATVPSTTSSQESLAWAVQQLETCKQSHKACNSFPPAPLPSRVLDVLANGGSSVRLYVTQGETAAYTALSHCWGHKPFLRTLSGSLNAHQAEIVWARLPTTFQDAIEFTRKLGIRYLWIDSLCIVQDDQHDWRREAAKMASVYQNAALVISAAKSEGAYGGLYADFPLTHRTHTVIFTPGQLDNRSSSPESSQSQQDQDQPEPKPEQIHVRLALSHTHRLLSPYHAPTSSLPIFTRGWILQERFLSPRILHFGPEELSFECLESSTCQCTPVTPSSSSSTPGTAQSQTQLLTPPTWYTHMLDRTARPKHYYSLTTWLEETETEPRDSDSDADGGKDENRSGKRRKMSDLELQTVWRRLVEDYTHLRLTHDKDIFPAVSGMARQMQRARGRAGARYVAGLWEDTLLLGDLLWHVELPPEGYTVKEGGAGAAGGAGAGAGAGGGGRGGIWAGGWVCRPGGWRAPSWSWASVRAPVGFVGGEEGVQAACEVVEVVCEPDGVDPMGELREGGSWLVLKGRLIPALLRYKNGVRGKQEGLQPWNVVELDVLDGGHLKNLWVDDDCEWLARDDGGQPEVYCLVVGRKLPRKELLCLLLARVPQNQDTLARNCKPDEERHLYKRIGMVEVFGGPPSPVPWGWLHNLLGKGEDAVVRIV